MQTGAKVERRSPEDRGAEGAEWPSAAGASIEAPKPPRGVGNMHFFYINLFAVKAKEKIVTVKYTA